MNVEHQQIKFQHTHKLPQKIKKTYTPKKCHFPHPQKLRAEVTPSPSKNEISKMSPTPTTHQKNNT